MTAKPSEWGTNYTAVTIADLDHKIRDATFGTEFILSVAVYHRVADQIAKLYRYYGWTVEIIKESPEAELRYLKIHRPASTPNPKRKTNHARKTK